MAVPPSAPLPLSPEASPAQPEGRLFSQEELERIVGERLARARSRFDKELAAALAQATLLPPEETEELRRQLAAREAQQAAEHAAWSAMQAGLRQEIENLQAEVAALRQRLQGHQLDAQVRQAAQDAGILPDDLADVLVLTAGHFRLNADGTATVLDDAGEPTEQTVAEFFARTFRQRRPRYYAPPAGGGSGSPAHIASTPADSFRQRLQAALAAGDVAAAIALKNQQRA